MYSSKVLMNELSCSSVTVVSAARAVAGAKAAPVAPATAILRKSRRDLLLIGPSPCSCAGRLLCGGSYCFCRDPESRLMSAGRVGEQPPRASLPAWQDPRAQQLEAGIMLCRNPADSWRIRRWPGCADRAIQTGGGADLLLPALWAA